MGKERGFVYLCAECGEHLKPIIEKNRQSPWEMHIVPCQYCINEKVVNKLKDINKLIKETYLKEK